jgi:growth arrest-specific protein 8
MPAKSKKGKKKSKVTKPLVPIPEDLVTMTAVELREAAESLQTQIAQAIKDRAYVQVERDMVSRLVDVCRTETEQVNEQILLTEYKAEEAANDHLSKIRAYQHRALALSAESQTMRGEINKETLQSIQSANAAEKQAILDNNQARRDLSKDLDRQQIEHDEEIANIRVVYAQNLVSLKEQFEQQHAGVVAHLQERHAALEVELDLRHRMDVHELEERKNQHLANLRADHQEAFSQIKAYYKEITTDNLNLICKLKDEIEHMKDTEKAVQQNSYQLGIENRTMSEPMAKLAEEKSKLSGRFQLHTNNISALRNLGSRQVQVEKAIKDTKREIHRLEDKIKKAEKEKDEVLVKFEEGITEINKVTQLRNSLLHQKIRSLEKMAPTTEVDDSKAALALSDLEYQLKETAKSFIDTKKVLDAKLGSLGQPPLDGYSDQLPIAGISSAPADLVGH